MEKQILKMIFGFNSIKEAKDYLVKHAVDNYGCKSIEIKKNRYILRYASNCKPSNRFAIGGNFKGSFMEWNF